jgi:hypothetical protein
MGVTWGGQIYPLHLVGAVTQGNLGYGYWQDAEKRPPASPLAGGRQGKTPLPGTSTGAVQSLKTIILP